MKSQVKNIRNNRSSNNATFAFAPRLRQLILALGLLTFFACMSAAAIAQNTEYIAISQLSHSISYPSGTFDIGDSVTIEIHVGDAPAGVEDVLSMSLELHYTSNAKKPYLENLDLSTSWLGSGCGLTNTSNIDDNKKICYINALRDDGTATDGFGEIFTFTLISNANNVTAASLVASLDGGITAIDNVEMKVHGGETLEEEPAVSFRFYPNPVQHELHLEGMNSNESFRIFNASGQVVRNGMADQSGSQTVSVSSLAAGLYILQTGSGIRKRLIVN